MYMENVERMKTVNKQGTANVKALSTWRCFIKQIPQCNYGPLKLGPLKHGLVLDGNR